MWGLQGGCACFNAIWGHRGSRNEFEKMRVNLCGGCDPEKILPALDFPSASQEAGHPVSA